MTGSNHISQYRQPSLPVQTGTYSDGRPIYTFYAETAAQNGPTFNVSDYGATGDGVTDDTAALQAAINAAQATGGVVFLPAGVYLISATLVVSADNVQLHGVGRASQLVAAGGFTASTPMVQYTQPTGTYRYGAALRNLLITNTAVSTLIGVQLDGTYYAVVEQVDIEGVYATSIYLNGGSPLYGAYTHIRECHLGATPGGASSAGTGILFNNHEFNVIENCVFNWFNLTGGTGIKVQFNANVISNCTFDECDTGVWLSFCNATVIKGCSFDRGVTQFILLESGTGNVIVGNTFQGFVGTGSQSAFVARNNIADALIANNLWLSGKGWTNAVDEPFGTMSNLVFSNNDLGGYAVVRIGAIYRNNTTYNPLGALTPPAIPASGTPQSNTFGVDATVYVTGGTVTAIAVGGTATGLTSGAIRVPAGGSITLTYSVAPTWVWIGE